MVRVTIEPTKKCVTSGELDSHHNIKQQIKLNRKNEVPICYGVYSSILNELKEMGRQLYGVYFICKNQERYCCSHGGAKLGRSCLKSIIERGNPDKLIFATKDENVSSNTFLFTYTLVQI